MNLRKNQNCTLKDVEKIRGTTGTLFVWMKKPTCPAEDPALKAICPPLITYGHIEANQS